MWNIVIYMTKHNIIWCKYNIKQYIYSIAVPCFTYVYLVSRYNLIYNNRMRGQTRYVCISGNMYAVHSVNYQPKSLVARSSCQLFFFRGQSMSNNWKPWYHQYLQKLNRSNVFFLQKGRCRQRERRREIQHGYKLQYLPTLCDKHVHPSHVVSTVLGLILGLIFF